jgi:hypothetical protein
MQTSEAEKSGGKCPKCGGRTTQDLKHRGSCDILRGLSPLTHQYPKTKRDNAARDDMTPIVRFKIAAKGVQYHLSPTRHGLPNAITGHSG